MGDLNTSIFVNVGNWRYWQIWSYGNADTNQFNVYTDYGTIRPLTFSFKKPRQEKTMSHAEAYDYIIKKLKDKRAKGYKEMSLGRYNNLMGELKGKLERGCSK